MKLIILNALKDIKIKLLDDKGVKDVILDGKSVKDEIFDDKDVKEDKNNIQIVECGNVKSEEREAMVICSVEDNPKRQTNLDTQTLAEIKKKCQELGLKLETIIIQ
jgi:hypothetical protein